MLVAGPMNEQTPSLPKAELWTDQRRGCGTLSGHAEEECGKFSRVF